MRGADTAKSQRARDLRRASSEAELKALASAAGKTAGGLQIRASGVDGPFFADFACRERRLVIEVDGATHASDDQVAYDLRREAVLIRLGYRVLRGGNLDVYENLDGVLETILAALSDQAG